MVSRRREQAAAQQQPISGESSGRTQSQFVDGVSTEFDELVSAECGGVHLPILPVVGVCWQIPGIIQTAWLSQFSPVSLLTDPLEMA